MIRTTESLFGVGGKGEGSRSYFDSPSVLNKMAPVLFVFPRRNIWTSAVFLGATCWARVTSCTGAARMHKHMCAVRCTDAQKIRTSRKKGRGRADVCAVCVAVSLLSELFLTWRIIQMSFAIRCGKKKSPKNSGEAVRGMSSDVAPGEHQCLQWTDQNQGTYIKQIAKSVSQTILRENILWVFSLTHS